MKHHNNISNIGSLLIYCQMQITNPIFISPYH